MAFGSVPHPHSLASAYCFPFVVSFLLFYTLFDFSLPESAAPAILSGSLEQLVARKAHNLEDAGSSPAAATTDDIVNSPLNFYSAEVPRQ